MAETNILARYGIKEVADVTFYEISDGSDGKKAGETGAPVLYLDTLKVSTIEQTAEQAEARGGKGNPPLIIWDYGKEINVTLEDALFSMKSMAIMFGDEDKVAAEVTSLMRTVPVRQIENGKVTINGKVAQVSNGIFYSATGVSVGTWTTDTVTVPTNAEYLTFDMAVAGNEIEISANTFPGTYYVTGDTFARSETTGKDEFFQFIIPKAKVQSENTITLEAEGDPSVFNMSLRVMRPADGKMMKLVKYDITEAAG